MKKIMFLILALILVGCSGASDVEQSDDGVVTLKLNSTWAENNSLLIKMKDFIEKVDQKTNGSVKIEWGGGPEAIPPFQLVEALNNGIVDIVWTAHTYNVSNVPVMEAMKLTDAAVMRETGGFDFVNDIYNEKLNSHYIAAVTDGLTYNLYTKDPIETIDDFDGMSIRATPAYQAFVEGLGAGVVNMPPGEAYQALERGVIDGYGWPSVGVTDFGWQEVSKYIIQPSFYTVDVAILMSDNAWTKLNENQQKAILEAGREVEEAARVYYEQAIADEIQILKDEGMIESVLADDLAEKYLEIAYEKAWESALNVDQENAEKLQEFTNYTK